MQIYNLKPIFNYGGITMDLLKASTIHQTLEFLESHPGARVLAGGTDLVVQMRKRKQIPPALVDISMVAELSGIHRGNGVWTIGPATNLSAIVNGPFGISLSGLTKAARSIGSPQIRNTATVGGNICNASPAADMSPPLLALDARLTLVASQNGALVSRVVPLAEFFAGKGQSVRRGDELLTTIEFSELSENAYLSFSKLGLREALAISRICLAAFIEFDAELVKTCRIATGSLGETGQREYDIEKLLVGGGLTDQTIESAADALARSARERLTGRSTMPFKQEAVKGLLGHALRDIVKRRNSL